MALPPALTPHSSPIAINELSPAPAVVPGGEESFIELEGERLALDFGELGSAENWGQGKYPVVYTLLRFLLAGLTRRPVNTSTSEIQGDSYNLTT